MKIPLHTDPIWIDNSPYGRLNRVYKKKKRNNKLLFLFLASLLSLLGIFT